MIVARSSAPRSTLKGASLSVGALATAEAAQRLENVDQEPGPELAESFQQLKQVVEQARTCAHDYLSKKNSR